MNKIGKELKKNNYTNYKVVYGSINNKITKAFYINISSWVELKDTTSYTNNTVIRRLNKEIKQKLYLLLSNENFIFLDKDRTIVDLDIRESGLRVGKRSFMSCEITLFNKNDVKINIDDIKTKINDIVENIVKNILEKNETFKFNKRKL